jgi:hypothetical protein
VNSIRKPTPNRYRAPTTSSEALPRDVGSRPSLCWSHKKTKPMSGIPMSM